MIGDAPGDLAAAESVGACFFPINPGDEVESWSLLQREGLARFLTGRFRGEFQAELNARFQTRLPERPPWAR